MSKTVGRITAIKPEPEPDGSHMIKVAEFGEPEFEVCINPHEIAELIQVLQSGVLSRVLEQSEEDTPRFPVLTVDSVGLAHAGRETALLVTTAQTGSLVLRFSDNALQNLEDEIGRAKTFRAAPPGTH